MSDLKILNKGQEPGVKNPFPGLRPFGTDESHLYFGREGQSDEVLQVLSKNRFVTILGSSGTGKSSLMFSGVIPTLYGGFMADAGSKWEVLTARPGLSPLRNLAVSFVNLEQKRHPNLSAYDVKRHESLYASVLKGSSSGIIEATKILQAQSDFNLLIYLDQFEEIFRFKNQGETKHHDETIAYVNLILEAISQRGVNIYIALSMRSDFLGECEQFPELTNQINESHYLIPQMTRDQKRLVIEGPVAVGKGQITSRLTQRLLNEIGDRTDQLPVLQHSMMRTWYYWIEHRKDTEPLDIIHYEAIGGLDNALSRHSDEAFNELKPGERLICETIFKSVTEKRSDNDGIRRPTRVSEIANISNVEEEDIIRIVNRFRREDRALVMPPSQFKLTSSSLIDISHEALMRVWHRLRNWVQEEFESANMYLRLSEAADNFHRGKGGLWRPPDLQLAIEWKRRNKPTLHWALRYNKEFEKVMTFIETSEVAYNTELSNKELQQKRKLQRSRIIAGILGTAALLSSGLLIYAFEQKREADIQKADAKKNELVAERNEKNAEHYAQDASIQLEKTKKATRLAREKQREAENNDLKARRALIDVEGQREEAQRNLNRAEEQERVANGERNRAQLNEELAKQQKNNANNLRLRATARTIAIKSLSEDDIEIQSASAYIAHILNMEGDGYRSDNDIYNGLANAIASQDPNYFRMFSQYSNEVYDVAFTQDSSIMVTGSNGIVSKWNLKAGNTEARLTTQNNTLNRALSISEKGEWMLIGGNRPNVEIYNMVYGTIPEKLPIKGKGIYDLGFIPNTDRNFIYSSTDSLVYKYSEEQSEVLIDLNSRVYSFEIFNDGEYVVLGTEDGHCVVTTIRNGDMIRFSIHKPETIIRKVAASADGRKMAFGGSTGVVYLLELDENFKLVNELELEAHEGAVVSDIVFNESKDQLVTSGTNGVVKIWDLNNIDEFPISAYTDNSWVLSANVVPDGKYVLAGSKDKVFRKFPTGIKTLATELKKHLKRDLTPEEWKKLVGEDIPYRSILD